jgi:DNA-binding MarR family transcriptional regulator
MSDDAAGIPDNDFLRIFALSPDPVLSATEITEQLPVSNQAVNKRLNRFERDGLVHSKKVGASAKIYWLTDEGKEKLRDLD